MMREIFLPHEWAGYLLDTSVIDLSMQFFPW
jgi:hypothetical protein